MKDMAQFLVLSREHAEVSQIAGRYQRYQQRRHAGGGAALQAAVRERYPPFRQAGAYS